MLHCIVHTVLGKNNELKIIFKNVIRKKSVLLTLAIPLAAFEQSEFGRIVHHREFIEQSLDHLSGPSVWADMQLLSRVSRQVERRAEAVRGQGGKWGADRGRGRGRGRWRQSLRGRKRDRPSQLELDLYETCIGAVLVLREDTPQDEDFTLINIHKITFYSHQITFIDTSR